MPTVPQRHGQTDRRTDGPHSASRGKQQKSLVRTTHLSTFSKSSVHPSVYLSVRDVDIAWTHVLG